MNFMDLYLDAQKYHEDIDEPEKDVNHNELYIQYCECSLAIYEANNFIDLHYIKERYTLYAEVSTYVKAVGAFIVGAILLLMKIVIGLKAAILGAGLLFIMWLLKKLKGAFKKVQEFSINILTIVNQSIMLGPAASNNTQSKVYEELMYNLGIITYNVVADSAFNAFMQSDNTIDI